MIGLAFDLLGDLPAWGLSLLAGGPVGGVLFAIARNWKVVLVGALLAAAGTWIGIDQIRKANLRTEIATLRAAREAERADVAELARKAHAAAAAAAQAIAERHRADAAAALRTARAARQALARVQEEIARDPDARTPVAAPVGRYLDGVRRRAAGADAGPRAGGARGPGRSGADDVRGRAVGAAGRDRLRDLPRMGRSGAGGRPRLPPEKPLHRPPAGGAGLPGGVRL